VWKTAGKPKHGQIFDKRQNARLKYRKNVKEKEK
jgi:hypothetical protein